MRVWRLTSARYANSAFDGEGSRLFGGRWNHEGVAVVYTAEHLSLAILEQLVHARASRKLAAQVVITADIPDEITIEVLRPDDLPDDWRTVSGHDGLREMGSDWVKRADSAVLSVPSAVVPREQNIIINPRHADFQRIDIAQPDPFDFDPRLFS
jgi:RES domain-containing protein